MNDWMGPIVLLLLAWNGVAFLMMGFDKHRAKTKGFRVPERTLLGAAFLMGGTGILLGMLAFRHKTRHAAFYIGVPCAILFNAAVILLPSLLQRLL